MGIKKFFGWFKNRFADNIYQLQRGQTVADLKEDMDEPVSIDTCMIDMNGLFHNSAQKIYEYGSYKPQPRLLGRAPQRRFERVGGVQKQILVFRDICASVEKVLRVVQPKKRLIMCVDGIAPTSKQSQQRLRRFVSARDSESDPTRTFDSNCLTPGTKFMDYLTKYIDWYIRKQLSNPTSHWSKLEVIFSNEKAPGEGEHGLLSYLRKYGDPSETFCIHGMDADLIMLVLSSTVPNFYILREDPFAYNFEFYFIHMKNVRKDLANLMRWNTAKKAFKEERAITDFVFLCFTVGNDFLPHMPAIEIIEGGIDVMLDVYKNTGEVYGHLTKRTEKGLRFRPKSVKAFIGTLSQYEKGVLENKLLHKDAYFPDAILESCAVFKDGKYELDIQKYRSEYYKINLPNVDIKELCHAYLDGMQWVLSYYTEGVPNWRWKFPHHYAPFAFTLAQHLDDYEFKEYPKTFPSLPFIQLLSVLPPKSANLLPEPLNTLLTDPASPLIPFCPKEFEVDVSGMREEWEGIVLLPMADYATVEKAYLSLIGKVDERERKRNALGRSFIYTRSDTAYEFSSFYGDFTCRVALKPIDL